VRQAESNLSFGKAAESTNLDLLRSLAVLLVVGYHLSLFFGGSSLDRITWPLGRWGVLMFFVHTSLVLMLSLERQANTQSGVALHGAFMVRRLFRIAPLAFVVIAVIVVWRLPVGHLRDGHFHGVTLDIETVLANLLFLQNLTHSESLEAPLWSLPYEMQMYLLLPLLFFGVRRIQGTLALLLAWAGSTALCASWLYFDRAGWFDFPLYVPCFLSGIVAYRLTRSSHQPLPSWVWPVLLALCSTLYWHYPRALVAWLMCLLIGIGAAQCHNLPSGGFSRATNLIARYSYGIYLVHFVCIWLCFVELAAVPWAVQVGLFAISVVGIPVMLFHLVEKPMIALGARASSQPPKLEVARVMQGNPAP
jgi:peptidoglycan/LPS O-acetylase OafA/YrhL